jgi:hypothetical protein
MLDIIIFVTFIIGGSYAVYYAVHFLLKFIFQRKPSNWILLNYKKHSGVNFEKVEKVIATGSLPPEEFSHWEMVAVFGLLLLKIEASDVLQKAEVFGNQGWRKNFNYDFYEEIAHIAKKISTQGYKASARELIMFGQRLAELYGDQNSIEQYRKLLDEQLAELATLEWDFSRRVRN